MKKNNNFYVIAHKIRSAYNVGSILRTSDALGVAKVFLTGYTHNPANEEKLVKSKADKMLEKTALGAEKNVDWENREDVFELINELKKEGVKIVALEQAENSINYSDLKPDFPLALILGNEPDGVDSEILKLTDAIIEIPMFGMKQSLNVSVAFGIAGYELIKARLLW